MRDQGRTRTAIVGACLVGVALALVVLLGFRGGSILPRGQEYVASQASVPLNKGPSSAQPLSTGPQYPGGGSMGVAGVGPISMQPSYSPDGRQIAFVTESKGEQHIWIVGTDGSGLRQLTSNMNPPAQRAKSGDFEPAWSPDGTRIAFAANVAGSIDIWVIRPDGTNLTRLTTDPARHEMPAWSPNSAQIAFVSDSSGTSRIWIMNADGTNPRMIPSLLAANNPSFSPDGRQLVFSAPQSGGAGVNLMISNVDGTGLRQLTTGAFFDFHPRWSPRGIVFDTNRKRPDSLALIQPDGSGLQSLPGTRGGEPGVSPDGTKVAFGGSGIFEFNFVDNTIRPIVKITGYSIDIRAKETSCGPGPTLDCVIDVWVTIYSSPTFNLVNTLAQSSITFGATGDEDSMYAGSCISSNRPGITIPDLACKFSEARAGVFAGLPAILRARGLGQVHYEARGTVAHGTPFQSPSRVP